MTKKQIRKLDKLWKEAVHKKGKCEICGATKESKQLHAHHYIGRRNYSLRWCLDNSILLCCSHHVLSPTSAHENPEWFREQMIQKRGEEWLKALKEGVEVIYKGDYEKILTYLYESNKT